MKNITTLLILAFTSLINANDIKEHISYELGPEIYYYRYEEPDIMEQDGVFTGIKGAITYEKNISIKLDGIYAQGKTDYSSYRTGSMNDCNNYMYDIRALIGLPRHYYNNDTVIIHRYIGFGYRTLFDESEGQQSTTGHFGYNRKSDYYYMPIGISAKYKIFNRIETHSEIEFDWLLTGIQHSYMGYLSPRDYDITNYQDFGYGIRISTDFIYQTEKVNLGFRPFLRYWSINDSDIDMGFIEPANNTLEAGLSITAQF